MKRQANKAHPDSATVTVEAGLPFFSLRERMAKRRTVDHVLKISARYEPFDAPPGLGVRQSSGAVDVVDASESGRGLPQSKTLSRPNVRVSLFMVLSLSVSILCSEAQSPGALRREPNTTLRLPLSLDDPTALPPSLADKGAFADLASLTPHSGIVPYDLNVPFWSDGAHKTRWFCVPNTNLTIGFEREAPWSFPFGTIWIKHFELELTNGVPESARRLETRFLVRTEAGIYGVTYRWDDSQTNATLVGEDGLDEEFVIRDRGETRRQVYHYPSRADCRRCHTEIAGWALGFNTPQLNREFNYSGTATNQIAALNRAGYFNTNVTGLHTLRVLAHATNTAWSLEYRVRSYLAANCSQCHRPGGLGFGFWDARITMPTADAGIINGRLLPEFPHGAEDRVIAPGSLPHSRLFQRVANLGTNHMPPIATTVLNAEAIGLLREWITNGLANYQSFADWQVTHFNSTNASIAAPDADADGDGAINQLEYLTGGNPLLPGDAWKLSIQRTATTVETTIPRIANSAVEIQWTANLLDASSWVPLDHPANRPYFPSMNGHATLEDFTTTAPARFYRLRVFPP